jgi:hypothetical protein
MAAMKAVNCGSDQGLTFAVKLREHPYWMDAAHGKANSDDHGEVRTVPGLPVPQSAAAGSEECCVADAATESEEVSVVGD